MRDVDKRAKATRRVFLRGAAVAGQVLARARLQELGEHGAFGAEPRRVGVGDVGGDHLLAVSTGVQCGLVEAQRFVQSVRHLCQVLKFVAASAVSFCRLAGSYTFAASVPVIL